MYLYRTLASYDALLLTGWSIGTNHIHW